MDVETPSGKDVAYENFPVGSWLLPRRLRPHVATFYEFARAADDIADNPEISADEKISRLDLFEAGLLGDQGVNVPLKARRMKESLDETGVPAVHCVELLSAFKQDATKLRYRDWDDLLAYCRLSAATVGRYLLDLHGGARDGYASSDALCTALQIINHLQDCQDDYREMDRVYIPCDWMEGAGAKVEDLDGATTNPALSQVFSKVIYGVDELLVEARKLPVTLYNLRLAMESAAIVKIAERLTRVLERRDPLAERIELSKAAYLWCCARGALAAPFIRY
jgi:hydroxysqualene synthase